MDEIITTVEQAPLEQARNQIGVNLLRTHFKQLEHKIPPAAVDQPESEEQRALRIGGSILYLATGNANFSAEPNRISDGHKGNPEPDHSLQIDLGLTELNSAPEEFNMLGRKGTITEVVRLEGDQIVCRVAIPAEGDLAGNPSLEVSLKRSAVVASQLRAEPEAVVQFLSTMPEGPAKKALELYLNSFTKNNVPGEADQELIIEEAARASGLPLSADILSPIANRDIGEKPLTPHERWEAAKLAAESAGGTFDDAEPAKLSDAEQAAFDVELRKYEQAEAARDSKLQEAKRILGDKLIPDAKSLVELYRPDEVVLSEFSSTLAEATTRLRRAEEDVEYWQRVVTENKIPARNPETNQLITDPATGDQEMTDYPGSKTDARDALKRAELKLEFAQNRKNLAENAQAGNIDTELEQFFTSYLDGELDPEQTKIVTTSLEAGNLESLIGYLDEIKKKKFLDEEGKIRTEYQADYDNLEATIDRIGKLKLLGKGAAIGAAALIVMLLMQGLGGGGGGQ